MKSVETEQEYLENEIRRKEELKGLSALLEIKLKVWQSANIKIKRGRRLLWTNGKPDLLSWGFTESNYA